ncbi:MAG: nitrogen regulation protein NR(II) [Desulfomonilaceae bacterium]
MLDPVIVKSILNSMTDCLIVINDDGEVLFANKNTDPILGHVADDIREQGLGLTFFVREENYEFNQIFIKAIWAKRVHDYEEVNYIRPDGTFKRLAATTSFLLDGGENHERVIGFVAIFRDITEVYLLREREKRLNEEKQRIAGEKIRSLNKLAMGVAHEIRNPVVTIGGFANRIIKMNENPEETRLYARNIMYGVKRLEDVVEQIYGCANLPMIKTIQDRMSKYIGQAISEVQPKADTRNITIHFDDKTDSDCLETFDPELIKIALNHLLDNAIDFSSEGSSIEVRLYSDHENVILEVEDHGSGISAADQEFIFNPFFSTKAVSVGVGLTMVERIVNEHAARIEVESKPNFGSLFRILFKKNIDPELLACHIS